MPEAVPDPDHRLVADDPPGLLKLGQGRFDRPNGQTRLAGDHLTVVAKDTPWAGLVTQPKRVEHQAGKGREVLEIGIIGQGAVHSTVGSTTHAGLTSLVGVDDQGTGGQVVIPAGRREPHPAPWRHRQSTAAAWPKTSSWATSFSST